MIHDSRVEGSQVEDTMPNEPINAVIDRGQQLRHLRLVLLMAYRQRRSDDPTLGIHTVMQFLPVFVGLLTVLPAVPFPLTADLQAATVNDQGDRSFRDTIDLVSNRHGGIAT